MVCETPNQDNILTYSKKCSELPTLPAMYETIDVVTPLRMQHSMQFPIRRRENHILKLQSII